MFQNLFKNWGRYVIFSTFFLHLLGVVLLGLIQKLRVQKEKGERRARTHVAESRFSVSMIAIRVPSTGHQTVFKLYTTTIEPSRYPAVYLAVHFQRTVSAFGNRVYHKLPAFYTIRPAFYNDFKRCGWAIRSAADGNSVNSSPADDSSNGTRLVRAIQVIRDKLNSKIKDFKKNFSMKLLFFLVGFYSATAFATVIGQTGDWDILSAALAVAIVEGIGALMYKSSLPLSGQLRSLIAMFNYWKAGLSLGLFLDSFKY